MTENPVEVKVSSVMSPSPLHQRTGLWFQEFACGPKLSVCLSVCGAGRAASPSPGLRESPFWSQESLGLPSEQAWPACPLNLKH